MHAKNCYNEKPSKNAFFHKNMGVKDRKIDIHKNGDTWDMECHCKISNKKLNEDRVGSRFSKKLVFLNFWPLEGQKNRNSLS